MLGTGSRRGIGRNRDFQALPAWAATVQAGTCMARRICARIEASGNRQVFPVLLYFRFVGNSDMREKEIFGENRPKFVFRRKY